MLRIKSMFLCLLSESALSAVELQPRHQTNRFIFSLTHKVAEQLISTHFGSASLTLLVPNKQSHGCKPCFLWMLKGRETGRLWNKQMCSFSISVDLITFWMSGKSFANLWMNITFHKTFEERRLLLDSCSFGVSLCILNIIVDTGVFLNSSNKMPKLTLQSLKLVWVFCCKSCYRCLKCLAGNGVKLKTLCYLVALFFFFF